MERTDGESDVMYEGEVVTKAELVNCFGDVGENMVGKGWKKVDSG